MIELIVLFSCFILFLMAIVGIVKAIFVEPFKLANQKHAIKHFSASFLTTLVIYFLNNEINACFQLVYGYLPTDKYVLASWCFYWPGIYISINVSLIFFRVKIIEYLNIIFPILLLFSVGFMFYIMVLYLNVQHCYSVV